MSDSSAMSERAATCAGDTLIILTPGFAAHEADDAMPAQEAFIYALNAVYPALKVVILSFHYPYGEPREYNWHGNRVVAFGTKMNDKLQTSILWWRVWNMLKTLKKEHSLIGMLSFFCSESAFIGQRFAKRHGLKHLIWIFGQDAKKENRQVRRIRPKAEELVAISDFLVDTFQKNHEVQPAQMIPLGIDTTLFDTTPSKRELDLLGVGSLIPLKQYDVFVRVVKKIAEAIPSVQATICGEGPEMLRLMAMLKQDCRPGQITLAGKLAHSDTLKTMQRSKLLLHTSSYEGLGVVCLEALYAGAHVISFCKPFKEAIPHWHVAKDETEMVEKALQLLHDQTLDHTPVLPFEVQSIAKQLMQIFGTEK